MKIWEMKFNKPCAIAFLVGFFLTFLFFPIRSWQYFLFKADIGLIATILWGLLMGKVK